MTEEGGPSLVTKVSAIYDAEKGFFHSKVL